MTTLHLARPIAARPTAVSVRCRRFTLLDLMALIAATAAAFALSRPYFDRPRGWFLGPVLMLPPLLITWTPTVLFLRLRAPRPNLRRVMRQPGAAALVAATAMLAVVGLLMVVIALRLQLVAPRRTYPPWWAYPTYVLACVVGPAVIGTWAQLAVSRRRRPEPGWLDHLGRWIGAGWITLFGILAGVFIYNYRGGLGLF